MMRFEGIAAGVPSGTILFWSGAIVDIPTGYVLCDGNNSTPDLRDRFIIGAGSTFDPADTGGSTQHEHGGDTNSATDVLGDGDVVAAGGDMDENTSGHFHTIEPESDLRPPYYALALIYKT